MPVTPVQTASTFLLLLGLKVIIGSAVMLWLILMVPAPAIYPIILVATVLYWEWIRKPVLFILKDIFAP